MYIMSSPFPGCTSMTIISVNIQCYQKASRSFYTFVTITTIYDMIFLLYLNSNKADDQMSFDKTNWIHLFCDSKYQLHFPNISIAKKDRCSVLHGYHKIYLLKVYIFKPIQETVHLFF